MKQDAKNKLIFVAGSVFGLVVLGALVQVVGAQYQWAPPNETFPNANTAPPIDISATGQKKTGNISIEVGSGLSAVTVSNNTYVGTLNSRIIFGAGPGQNTMIMYGEGVTLPHGTAALSNTDEGMIRYNVGGKKVQFNDGAGWKDVGSGGSSYWTPTTGGIAYTGGTVFVGLDGEQWGYVPTGSEHSCTGSGSGGNGGGPLIPMLPTREAHAAEDCSTYTSARMVCDESSTTADCTESFYSAQSNDKSTRYDQYHKSGDPQDKYYYKAFSLTTKTLENTAKLVGATLSASKSICIGSDCRTQWPGGLTYATVQGGGSICVDHYLAIRYRTDGDKSQFEVSGTDPDARNFNKNCNNGLFGAPPLVVGGSWRYSKSGGAMQGDVTCGTSATTYHLCPWTQVTVKFKKENNDHYVMASGLIEMTVRSSRGGSTLSYRCARDAWCKLNDNGVSADGSYFSFLDIKDTDSGQAVYNRSTYMLGPERLSYE